MAYRIEKTELAEEDLDEIICYLVKELNNRPAAIALLNDIEHCYDNLERMPYLYPISQDSRLNAMGYRKVVIRNYVMLYLVDEGEKRVNVMRFFHGRQDYQKIL